jgi:hypothetical protein
LRLNYLRQLQSFDLQLSGVQFLELQSHFFEQTFSHLLPEQQLLSFVLLPARAAAAISIAEPAIKILRFIMLTLKN